MREMLLFFSGNLPYGELVVALVDPLEEGLGHLPGFNHDLLQLVGGAKNVGLRGFDDLEMGNTQCDQAV